MGCQSLQLRLKSGCWTLGTPTLTIIRRLACGLEPAQASEVAQQVARLSSPCSRASVGAPAHEENAVGAGYATCAAPHAARLCFRRLPSPLSFLWSWVSRCQPISSAVCRTARCRAAVQAVPRCTYLRSMAAMLRAATAASIEVAAACRCAFDAGACVAATSDVSWAPVAVVVLHKRRWEAATAACFAVVSHNTACRAASTQTGA